MRDEASDISSYVFRSTDRLLLDANIWLFNYGPHEPQDWHVRVYSRALSRILAAKCCIYVDVLVINLWSVR